VLRAVHPAAKLPIDLPWLYAAKRDTHLIVGLSDP
jgi:hypothetical protein